MPPRRSGDSSSIAKRMALLACGKGLYWTGLRRQGASGDEQISPGTIIEGQHLAFIPRYRASLRAAQPRSATVSLASDCAQARVTAELSCLLPNVAAQPPFSTKPG